MFAEALPPGTTLDRYVVEAEVGRGGAGRVYRVRHQVLDRRFALKILRVPDTANVERLLREARLLDRLDHPHIVAARDVLDVAGTPALLLDWVDGEPLPRWLARQPAGRLDYRAAARLYLQLLDAVGYCHAQGIVHRDLKPGNVMVVEQGGPFLRVLDFGVARLTAPGPQDVTLTETGVALGTPPYMAPEQVRGAQDLDGRVDLWALGCVFYELVYGQRTFPQSNALDTWNAILASRWTPPRKLDPHVPAAVERVILASLARREERVADAHHAAALLGNPLSLPERLAPPAVGAEPQPSTSDALMSRSAATPAPTSPETTLTVTRPQRPWLAWSGAAAIGFVGLLALGAAGWVLVQTGQPDRAPAASGEAAGGADAAIAKGAEEPAVAAPPAATLAAPAGPTAAPAAAPAVATPGAASAPASARSPPGGSSPRASTTSAAAAPPASTSTASTSTASTSTASTSTASTSAASTIPAAAPATPPPATPAPLPVGTVRLAPDPGIQVSLFRSGAAVPAGEVAVGDYELRARWTAEGAWERAGRVRVVAGRVVTVRCAAASCWAE